VIALAFSAIAAQAATVPVFLGWARSTLGGRVAMRLVAYATAQVLAVGAVVWAAWVARALAGWRGVDLASAAELGATLGVLPTWWGVARWWRRARRERAPAARARDPFGD
jgi:hypothetical protein